MSTPSKLSPTHSTNASRASSGAPSPPSMARAARVRASSIPSGKAPPATSLPAATRSRRSTSKPTPTSRAATGISSTSRSTPSAVPLGTMTPAEKQRVWDLVKNAPPPVGYDPAMFWPGGPQDPDFGALKLEPWRIELWSLSGRWPRQVARRCGGQGSRAERRGLATAGPTGSYDGVMSALAHCKRSFLDGRCRAWRRAGLVSWRNRQGNTSSQLNFAAAECSQRRSPETSESTIS